MPDLAHRDAQRVLAAVQRELEDRGLSAAELVAFVRTDGCPLPSIANANANANANAMNKAYTSARERRPSREIGDASRREQFPMTNFGDLRYTGWGGGVPLVVGGDVVGAVGVSGLPEADDMKLAADAAATLVT